MSVARALSLFFAAGAIGGLANSFVAWTLGELGVTRALGVALAPELTPAWLYPRIVWGGLWGLLFALPLAAGSWVRQGLLLGLAPALAQLLVFFPRQGRGSFGLELGVLTPAFVLLYGAVWGLTASWWVKGTRG